MQHRFDSNGIAERLWRDSRYFDSAVSIHFIILAIERTRLTGVAGDALLASSGPVRVSFYAPESRPAESSSVSWALGELQEGRASFCELRPEAQPRVHLRVVDCGAEEDETPCIDVQVYIQPVWTAADPAAYEEFRNIVAYVGRLVELLKPCGVNFVLQRDAAAARADGWRFDSALLSIYPDDRPAGR